MPVSLSERCAMKLSDAILLGSTLSEQGFGNDGLIGNKRCAIGAGRQALGMEDQAWSIAYGQIRKAYPFIEALQNCPIERCPCNDSILGIIWHLNDSHRWTREQIAGWVATVEPQEEAPILPVGEYCDVHQEAVTK